MNCPADAAAEDDDGDAAGGGAGIEMVGGSAGDPEETHATVSGTAFTGAMEGTGGGATGGGAGGSGDTHATVAEGGMEGVGGGRGDRDGAEGGRGGGAGGSEGTFSREPHFSQKLDTAAFCAPHSSQNRTDSEAMTGPRARAQAPPNRWIKRCSKTWAMSSSSFAAAGSA